MPKSGLTELSAVVAVSTHKSFRRAAVELGMSPSALSHAVAGLEQRMGVRLFNRTTRSVSLSEAGEQFLGRVGPALREISEAMDAVNDFRATPTGTLRLNMSAGAAERIFAPLVLEFLFCRYPDMRVDLVTDDGFVDIVADGFDAGVRLAEAVAQDMIAVPVGAEVRFIVVGSPGYFERHPAPQSPADLLAHSCIRRRFATGGLYRWEFCDTAKKSEIDVPGVLTLGHDRLMIEAALSGVGLAYVNNDTVTEHVAAGRLVPVLLDWTPSFPGMRLYYPGNRHVPAGLRAFVELARELALKGN